MFTFGAPHSIKRKRHPLLSACGYQLRIRHNAVRHDQALQFQIGVDRDRVRDRGRAGVADGIVVRGSTAYYVSGGRSVIYWYPRGDSC